MEEYERQRGRSAIVAVSLIGVAAAGVLLATRGGNRLSRRAPRKTGVRVHEAITINRPLGEVFQFWRDFENHSRFMTHVESVQTVGPGRSWWRAKGPAGFRVEWESMIVGETENEWIAWRAVEGSDVRHSGAVRFDHAPGGRGTEVHVDLEYGSGGGVLGSVARLFAQDPETQLRHDLRRFKQLLEAGEIVMSDGPAMWRPAQPAEHPEEVRKLTGVAQ